MRTHALAVLVALLLAAPAALAGPPPPGPTQVTLETRLAEVSRLDFDLGFKLSCDHTVGFAFGTPGILQAVNVPALTRKQSFEFQVLSFGETTVQANFTGSGGSCAGSGSAALLVTVKPDLTLEVRQFTRDAKLFSRTAAGVAGAELDGLEDDLGEILADYEDGLLDENEAAAELFGATASSLAFVAAELTGGLGTFAGQGSALLDAAGALSLPRAFRTGKGSVWEGVREAASGTYSEFAIEAQELLCEALAVLDDTRVNVRLEKRFGPFLVHGPSLAGDPDDVIVLPTQWLGAAAWNGPLGRGLIGAGYGVEAGGTEGRVRLVGPGGRDETSVEPYETSPRQNLLRLIRPRLVAPSLSASAFTIDNAPGNWRLELRYADDANASDIVQLTAP
jgi:hypothetical protein